MRRQRRQQEYVESQRNARAWCCLVAMINVVVITAYHIDAPSLALSWYGRVTGSGVPTPPAGHKAKTPPPLRGEALHRYHMGDDHHKAFDDQHAGVIAHHQYDESADATTRASLSLSSDVEMGMLACTATGGCAFRAEPFAALQFHAAFLPLRSDVPMPRSGLRAWLRRCVNGSTMQTADATCLHGFTSRGAPAIVPSHFLLGFTLNATIPLRYHFRGRERKRSDGELLAVLDELSNATANATVAGAENVTTSMLGTATRLPTSPPQTTSGAGRKSIFARLQRTVVKPSTLQAIYEELFTMLKDTTKSHGYRGHFLRAVERYKQFLRGQSVLVVGSLDLPVVEVAALAMGDAKRVVSIEHRPFEVRDKRIVSATPEDHWIEHIASNSRYDVAISYSVLQHDGLGRFGDVLNPDGDLEAMNELWSLLRPGALLLLAVPLGNDCVVFNTHRVYGRRRLPLLLRGWSIVEAVGMPEGAAADAIFEDHGCSPKVQPTLVLRRTIPGNAMDELRRIPGLHGDFPVYFG
jgi:hypothetical protein